MDGNEGGSFLKLCITRIEEIALRTDKPLNERQCANLLSRFRRCLHVLQNVLGPSIDGCGPLWKDLFRIVSKASLLLEICLRDDWYQAAVMQNNNKEDFRELLIELEGWFHTICLKVRNDPHISLRQMEELELCTTLYPSEVDEVAKDQIFLQERLANEVKMLSYNSNDFKLVKYLLDMMGCISKVEEGDLSTSQFPTKFHRPEWGCPPQTLGATGHPCVQVHATTWLGLSTATKTMKVQDMKMKKHLEKEALIVAGLHHPNIAKFFYCGYVEDTKDLLFGMEKGEKNLSDLLFIGTENITYASKLDIMLQVASGMYYLHDMKVAHRDLKPANVIITSLCVPKLHNDGYVVAKLVDFGASKNEVKENLEVPTSDFFFGTRGYAAPEAMNVELHKKMHKVDPLKVDVFSFGVLCYEILTQRKSPFAGLKRDALLERLREGKGQIKPYNMPLQLRLLIEECWCPNPSERPTFSHIYDRLVNIKRSYFVETSTTNEISHPSIYPMMDVEKWFENLLKNFWTCIKGFVHICCRLLPIFSHGWGQGSMRTILGNPTSRQTNDISRSSKHVVGVEKKLVEFEKKLGKSKMLGIVGMGGLGKTTFVKALVERLEKGLKQNVSSDNAKTKFSKHDGSVANVEALKDGQCTSFDKIVYIEMSSKNVSDKDNHLSVMGVILENLHSQGNIIDLKHGREILSEILRKKKVLLILDDVGGTIQLDLLLTSEMFNVGGSKLIATSRDWDKLNCVIKDSSSKVILDTLDEDESMILFFKHAFMPSQSACPPYLQELSTKIVKACGGLPLSLEVIGSHLCGRARIRVWERALQRLLNANLEDGDDDMKLWNTLNISFDDLIEEEKKVFLDIACYFCKDVEPEGVHTYIALHFWNDSLGNAQNALSSLVNKSLVRVEDDGTLNMHDQLRDVGRMLSKTKFGDARKWDWSLKSINKYALKSFQNVEGLCFVGNNEDFRQGCEPNIQLANLRLLSYKSCRAMDMICSFVKESEDLRWLSIKFSKENLEYINKVSGNEMFSKLVEHNKLKNLQVLIIMDSLDLRSFPENTLNLPSLRSLTIQRCEWLETLDPTIGSLLRLESITLKQCQRLKKIPNELKTLTSLSILNVHECPMLRSIPQDLGDLTSLKKFILSGCCALEAVPPSVCKLSLLQELCLKDCKVLKEVPQDLGDLVSLTMLILSRCEALEAVPPSVCKLSLLQVLSLKDCKVLKEIPEDLGDLVSLTVLELSGCEALEAVPPSVCKLSLLQELWLKDCKVLKEVPQDLGDLVSLTKLVLEGCEALEAVSPSVCKLSLLQELGLKDCKVLKEVPQDLGDLVSLTKLSLSGCEALEAVPPSVCKLSLLQFLSLKDCEVLKEVPQDLGDLVSLIVLELSGCEALEAVPPSVCKLSLLQFLSLKDCEVLKEIPEDLGDLVSLTMLELSGCEALQAVPPSVCKLSLLQFLSLKDCEVLKEIPEDLGDLVSLTMLVLEGCIALEAVPPSVCKLSLLQELSLKDCKVLKEVPQDLGDLVSLTKLVLEGCIALEAVPPSVCKLSLLQELSLKDCEVLKEIPEDLGDLVSLIVLELSGCEALEAVPPSVCKLSLLQVLSLKDCKVLKEIPEDLGDLVSLTMLELSGCTALEAVPPSVCKLSLLQVLSLKDCKVLKEIPEDLGDLVSLTMLELSGCTALEAVPPTVCKLSLLQVLSLKDCEVLKEIPEDLGDLVSLTVLELSGCEALQAVPPSVCKLSLLQGLSLKDCEVLKEIPEDLGDLVSLTMLVLEGCIALEAVPPSVCKLSLLQELSLKDCKVLKEVPPNLGELVSLTKLSLSGCEALEAVPPSVCKLSLLQVLSLKDCKVLKEIPEDLGDLVSLTMLELSGCTALEAVPPTVCKLSLLQVLSLKDCEVLKEIPEDLGDLVSLTVLDISGCLLLEAVP